MTKVHYFVEGQCEKKLIEALKQNPCEIISGKVQVFNVINQLLSRNQLLSVNEGFVVFVFDTDVKQTNILKENISRVKQFCPKKVKILYLVQVPEFESELTRATDVKNVVELTSSKSQKDFKTDFIALKDCRNILIKHNFDIRKMWIQDVPEPFSQIAKQGSSSVVNKNPTSLTK